MPSFDGSAEVIVWDHPIRGSNPHITQSSGDVQGYAEMGYGEDANAVTTTARKQEEVL
jgi:hypothetical protein